MQESQEIPLKELAVYAAQMSIKGSSFKRNSLLKPLDIILQELDRCPNPDDENELELIRAATKELIFDHLERIAKDGYKLGKTKQSKINNYVDLFFEGVLKKAHRGKVNKLLSREKLIRAAYLFWVRQAWAEILVSKGKAKDIALATDELQKMDEATEEVANAAGVN
jgi:CRISPR-associated protein Csc3